MKPDWCPQWAWDQSYCGVDVPDSIRETIARALLQAEQRGRQGMLPLVEQAYRDGVTYATICDVEDKDMAWEQSSIRAKALEKVGG